VLKQSFQKVQADTGSGEMGRCVCELLNLFELKLGPFEALVDTRSSASMSFEVEASCEYYLL
jgi:hypothetical protein